MERFISFGGRLDWRYDDDDAQQIKMRPKSLQKTLELVLCYSTALGNGPALKRA